MRKPRACVVRGQRIAAKQNAARAISLNRLTKLNERSEWSGVHPSFCAFIGSLVMSVPGSKLGRNCTYMSQAETKESKGPISNIPMLRGIRGTDTSEHRMSSNVGANSGACPGSRLEAQGEALWIIAPMCC